MGLLASFHAIDDATLASSMNLDEDELIEYIEEFCDDDDVPDYDMDKNWDMLHFVLTGVSASRPIRGNPLSQAIVGMRPYDVESFISAIPADDVQRILGVLRVVKFDTLRGRCDLALFRKHNLYPMLAETTKREEDRLWDTLADEFRSLIGFYSDAPAHRRNVIVSIYGAMRVTD